MEDIKVGDHVVVTSSYDDNACLHVVQRVTKTSVTIGEERYSRTTGRLFGSSEWSGPHFQLYVPERHNAALERHQLRRRIQAARRALINLQITADNIAKIEALLKELNA